MNRESNFYITPNLLRQRGACNSTILALRGFFGVGPNDRVFLTEDNVRRLLESDHYHRVMWPAYSMRYHRLFRQQTGRMGQLYDQLDVIVNGAHWNGRGSMFHMQPKARGAKTPQVYDILLEMASLLYQARGREDNYAIAA